MSHSSLFYFDQIQNLINLSSFLDQCTYSDPIFTPHHHCRLADYRKKNQIFSSTLFSVSTIFSFFVDVLFPAEFEDSTSLQIYGCALIGLLSPRLTILEREGGNRKKSNRKCKSFWFHCYVLKMCCHLRFYNAALRFHLKISHRALNFLHCNSMHFSLVVCSL